MEFQPEQGVVSERFDPVLDPLNAQQKEAVLNIKGPMLILAGAGSGKTRVITHRFAYIVREGFARPSEILAVTFTNKAGEEMQKRIQNLLGRPVSELWVRTFHSTGLRILRMFPEEAGLKRGFVVYDDADAKSLIKKIMRDLNIDTERFRPDRVYDAISRAKDDLLDLPAFSQNLDRFGDFFLSEVVFPVYEKYEEVKASVNAVDFGDLILLPVKLMNQREDILSYLRSMWKFVMVDEFQDTNYAQYEFAKLIGGNGNICIVGDDDQSIYAWRGAVVENLNRFLRDFPDAVIVKLERNYRSTETILKAANSVVSKIISRMPKEMWTDRTGGEPIVVYRAYNEYDEADFIAGKIRELVHKGEYSFGDIAVFYRTNYMSRLFEETFRKNLIPYRIFGAVPFYERKEVKDLLAYLRLAVNPRDITAVQRVINVPRRGIGRVSEEKIVRLIETGESIVSAVAGAEGAGVKGKALKGLKELSDLLLHLSELIDDERPSRILELLVERVNYLEYIASLKDGREQERIENIWELKRALVEWEENGGGLADFLENAVLRSSSDEVELGDYVNIMTLHTAKGLEFPVVFIAGVEEGLIPHYNSFANPKLIDEERRLFYVGITRAKDRVFMSFAIKRRYRWDWRDSEPSRFIRDIPFEFVREVFW